ncbi:hypothetical protein J2T13_001523 [Paenibacillus sp. DS2015]|uniref:YcdB/YcdC domain-containing protein n=1 Tax=Paenibacillus sp. DS2015 TaxID=3373917 RepID=UPI003D1D0481
MNTNQTSKHHVKKVIVTMAALLILLQQPAWAADSKVASITTQATLEESESSGEDLKVTSNDIPKGASISSEQAWQKLISAFPMLSDATVSSAEYGKTNSYPPDYTQVWTFNISYSFGNSSFGFSATIDAVSGEALSVHLPSNILERLSTAKDKIVTDKEAEVIAKQWLSKNLKNADYAGLHDHSEIYMNSETPSLFAPTSYNYYYTIWVNGLPSDVESINISVSRSGDVVSYNRHKTTAAYPSATPTLSQSAMDTKYRDSFDVELAYIPESIYSNSIQKQKYFLGYKPLDSHVYSFDAHTGKPLDSLNGNIEQLGLLDKKIDLPQSGDPFVSSSKSISADDAAALLATKIGVPQEYILENKQAQSKWDDPSTKTWNLHWRSANDSMNSDISAEVNVKTGQVYSYNSFISYSSQGEITYPTQGPALTDTQLQQKAIKLVTNLVPNASNEYKLAYISTPKAKAKQPTYNYHFQRYFNGIPVSNNQVQLALSADGTVQSFYLGGNVDLTKLPQNSKTSVSKEEARNVYLSKLNLQLKYGNYGGMWSGSVESPAITKLVYAPQWSESTSGTVWLDAQSGKWRNTYYGAVSTTSVEAKDIKDHPSEKSLLEIIKHGILIPDEQGNVHPDATLKAGDWLNMSARALYPTIDSMNRGGTETLYGGITSESPYYNSLQSFIELGWLNYNVNTVLNLDKVLTRDELAVSLVSMLQYEKLSHFYNENSDVAGISDASSIPHKGAVGITMKLGLLPALDGKFLPDRAVTRAEASEVLLRLADLIGKTDRFMSENYRY